MEPAKAVRVRGAVKRGCAIGAQIFHGLEVEKLRSLTKLIERDLSPSWTSAGQGAR